jgi:hypothetical protein
METNYDLVLESPSPLMEKKSKTSGCWIAHCCKCGSIWKGEVHFKLIEKMIEAGVLI